MAIGVLTRLHLLTLEQVAGRDVKPARTRLNQLIACNSISCNAALAGGFRMQFDQLKRRELFVSFSAPSNGHFLH